MQLISTLAFKTNKNSDTSILKNDTQIANSYKLRNLTKISVLRMSLFC